MTRTVSRIAALAALRSVNGCSGGEITYLGAALGAIRTLNEIERDLELLYSVRPDVRGKNVRNAVE